MVIEVTSALLKKVALSAAGFVVSSIVSGLDHFLDLSLGKAIAYAWDRIDKYPNDGEVDYLC